MEQAVILLERRLTEIKNYISSHESLLTNLREQTKECEGHIESLREERDHIVEAQKLLCQPKT